MQQMLGQDLVLLSVKHCGKTSTAVLWEWDLVRFMPPPMKFVPSQFCTPHPSYACVSLSLYALKRPLDICGFGLKTVAAYL